MAPHGSEPYLLAHVNGPMSLPNQYFNNANIIAPLAITSHINAVYKNSSGSGSTCSSLNHEIFKVLEEIVPEFLTAPIAESGSTSTSTSKSVPMPMMSAKVMPQDLIVNNLTGGLSNYLLTVSLKLNSDASDSVHMYEQISEQIPRTLLFRLHTDDVGVDAELDAGKAKDASSLIDRNLENQISAELSQAGIAPKYYGRFLNGRIEEFYEEMRTLCCSEMSELKYAKAIAVQLAKLHKMEISSLAIKSKATNEYKEGQIWERIEGWVGAVQNAFCSGGTSTTREGIDVGLPKQQCQLVNNMLREIQCEWKWLKSHKFVQPEEGGDSDHPHFTSQVRRALEFSREIVFAHNDCQSLNILTPRCRDVESRGDGVDVDADDTDQGLGDVRLIDFEYAGMNRRAVDLGNTFAEFCDMTNLEPDYGSQYPSDSVQNAFLKAYMEEYYDGKNELDDNGSSTVDMNDDVFLATLRQEIEKHSLLSHLGWASWSLLQSTSSSGIEFDYVRYAAVRLEGYRFFKGKFYDY